MRRSLFVLLSLCAVVTAQTKPAAGWKLVSSDEFNTPGRPDPAKWGVIRLAGVFDELARRLPVRGPAYWTLGVSGEWPSNGEIDIMEYYRGTLLANAAWGTAARFRAAWNTLKKPIAEFNDPKWSEKFHVWRMDWDRDFIKLYLDDVLLNTVDLSRTINGDGSGKKPFHQPHYILLNLAIGGDNGGDPSTTVFPAKLEVDYVRIHQRQ